MHIVTFTSGTQDFAVPAAHTLEIVRMVEVTPLPSESGKVNGLINYRGELVPVIDVQRYFDHELSVYSLESVLVVIDYHRQKSALACQDVSHILEVADHEIQAYQGLGQDYCHSAFHFEGKIYPLLNLERVNQEIHAALQN